MIYCCGEALIDMIPLSTPEGTTFLPVGGGAAWNAAVALGRLGARAGLVAGLSRDAFGQRLAADVEAAGVDTRQSPRFDRPTAIALVTLSATGVPEFSIRDEGSAGRLLTEADLPKTLPGAEAAIFGGISLVAEPSGGAFEALYARLPPRVVRVLDPNIRPQFIAEAGALRARLAQMLPGAHIVKLSAEDLDWLTDRPEHYIASLLDAGTLMVCETLGEKGMRLHRRGERFSLPARRVTLADTVGAGDTFNAGLLAALQRAGALSPAALAEIRRDGLERALRFALDAAALSVTRKGANPPTRAEVEATRWDG